jgi:hypothetical protein
LTAKLNCLEYSGQKSPEAKIYSERLRSSWGKLSCDHFLRKPTRVMEVVGDKMLLFGDGGRGMTGDAFPDRIA